MNFNPDTDFFRLQALSMRVDVQRKQRKQPIISFTIRRSNFQAWISFHPVAAWKFPASYLNSFAIGQLPVDEELLRDPPVNSRPGKAAIVYLRVLISQFYLLLMFQPVLTIRRALSKTGHSHELYLLTDVRLLEVWSSVVAREGLTFRRTCPWSIKLLKLWRLREWFLNADYFLFPF